ncbi:MAG: PAS domain-containing protein [Anaerolineae bacterium]|nr:PAS domain-containing protein [Anaerolineae bacterium]
MYSTPGDVAEILAELLYSTLQLQMVCVVLSDPGQKIDVKSVWFDGSPVPNNELDHINILLEPYIAANNGKPASFPHPFRKETLRIISVRDEVGDRQCLIAGGSTDQNFPNEIDRMLLQTTARQAVTFLNYLLDENSSDGNQSPFYRLLKYRQAKNSLTREHAQENDLEAMFEALLDYTPIGLAFFDRDHRYVRLNSILADMNGLPVEGHYGHTVNDILPSQTAQLVNDGIRQVFDTGNGLENVEITGETSAIVGQTRHWVTSFYPVFDNEKLLYVGETVIEVTEGKQTVEALQESHALLQAIFSGTGDAIYVKDRQSRYVIINAAGANIVGKSVEEVIGKPVSEVVSSEAAQKIINDEQQVMADGQARTFEDAIELNGTVSYYHSVKAPYYNIDGDIVGIIGITRDITAQKRKEQHNRLLAKAGEILSSSLDYATRLANVVELAIPDFADWCVVSVQNGERELRQVVAAHVNPEKIALVEKLQWRYPGEWVLQDETPGVLSNGQSQFYATITDEMLQHMARDAEHLQLLQDLQIHSAIRVPLKARGYTLGALTLVWTKTYRNYTQADLVWAEELGRRAGLAIDNARLFDAERQARHVAEFAVRRIAGLQEVTASLAKALTPDAVASAVIKQGIGILEASSGAIVAVDELGENLVTVGSFGYSADEVEKWHKFPISANTPLSETVRIGEPIILETFGAVQERYPEFAQEPCSPYETLITLPLGLEDNIIGGIGLCFTERRQFHVSDLNFMTALARQCAQALERARLFETERLARAEAEAAQEHLAILAEEKERNRLAQELHDNVAQALGYLNLKIAIATQSLSNGQIEEAQSSLAELKQVVNETYTDVREEIFSLRSEGHADATFLELLSKYINKYKRFYRLDIQLNRHVDDAMLNFSAETRLQVIRTIQEALINIRKHAQVNRAVIEITRKDEYIQICIEDEGCGFDAHQMMKGKEGSFGLRIMRERVASVGGNLNISSSIGEGTQTRITIPINR